MKYQDLLIIDGDIALDMGKNPQLIENRSVIAQDIVHAIIESGLAVRLVAERRPSAIADIETQIKILVEEDLRIMPGTVNISTVNISSQQGVYHVSADTIEFGSLSPQPLSLEPLSTQALGTSNE